MFSGFSSKWSEWQFVVPVAGCAVLVAVVSGIIVHYKTKKRNEPLFGSTIKTLPPKPGFYPAVPVQPSSGFSDQTMGVPAVFSGLHSHFGPTEDNMESGLSSTHARWSSMDKNSEHSDDEHSGGTTWRLAFKLQYDPDAQDLSVTIFRAKCYPEKYSSGLKTTVYVAVFSEPADTPKQTSLYPNTGSPSFDETFNFHTEKQDLGKRSVRCSLYELDHSRTRICLGHTVVKLADIPLLQGQPHYFNKELENLSTAMDEPSPELHISLSYNIQTEKLKIQLFAARNLPDFSGNRQFVLCTNVIVGRKVGKTKRTDPCNTLYGLFQCTYVFQIPNRHMDTCCLQFSVLQINTETGEERVYGQILIGPCMYAHGSGLEHWKLMLQNTRKTIEMWHKLVLT